MTRSRNSRPQPERRGWTLIELLVVCSTAAVLSVTGAVTIAMLMTAESRGAESLVQQTVISRLSAQFRADLHASTDATVEDVDGRTQNQLRLEQPDATTITWQIMADAVERRVTKNAADSQRERFRLPEHEMQFETLSDGRIQRLVIAAPGQLISDTTAGDLQPPVMHRIAIEAAVGWDLRHTTPAHGGAGE